MSRTLEQKTNHVGFPKPGELIEITGTHELEASDRGILNLLYQHAHDSGRMDDINAEWEVPLSDLRVAASHYGTNRVRDSLKRILRVVVTVPLPDPLAGEPSVLLTNLFDGIRLPRSEASGRGVVRFRLPRDLQPILARSNRWGRIKAEVACAMTSKYAIALYEMIQLRANMDRCIETFPIARFRDLMGVPPGTYDRGNDFAAKVTEPATLEVNGLSDMGVEISLIRSSKFSPIKDVTVAWWKKDAEAIRATFCELCEQKTGRMERLRTAAAAQPKRPPLALPAPRRVSRAAAVLAELDALYPTDQERRDHDEEYKAALSTGSKRTRPRGGWRAFVVKHVAPEAAAA